MKISTLFTDHFKLLGILFLNGHLKTSNTRLRWKLLDLVVNDCTFCSKIHLFFLCSRLLFQCAWFNVSLKNAFHSWSAIKNIYQISLHGYYNLLFCSQKNEDKNFGSKWKSTIRISYPLMFPSPKLHFSDQRCFFFVIQVWSHDFSHLAGQEDFYSIRRLLFQSF